MAQHRLQLTLDLNDEKPDEAVLKVTQRVWLSMAGVDRVSHAEDVTLDNEDEVKKSLTDLALANKDALVQAATPLVINHVAAVLNTPQQNTKRVALGGSLKALGEVGVAKPTEGK